MTNDALEYRVEFAIPYGYLMRAAALAGLRRFDEAHEALSDVAGGGGSVHGRLRPAGGVRRTDPCVACTKGRSPRHALSSRPTSVIRSQRCAVRSGHREDSLWRVWGDSRKPSGLRVDVAGTTRAIEPQCLVLCIDAVACSRARDPEPESRVATSRGWVRLTPEPWTSLSRATGRARTCSPPSSRCADTAGGDGLHRCPRVGRGTGQVPWVGHVVRSRPRVDALCSRTGGLRPAMRGPARTLRLRGGSSSHLRP